jgi:hypothetical protein
MAELDVPLSRLKFGQTSRKDAWWVQSAVTFTILSAFVIWSTYRVFEGNWFYSGHGSHYLSPMYSPLVFGPLNEAWFHTSKLRLFGLVTPALLILWAPAGFRVTCYYYRGAYYKAFWADPPACAVGEPRSSYRGERKWPLLIQNSHRFFAYLALVFLIFLSIDAIKAFQFTDPKTGNIQVGMGLGTLLMVANVTLLACYTFGCHSVRHMVGGRKDKLSDSPIQDACYNCSSWFNRRHMLFAWCSLICVSLTDVYVRFVSMGTFKDPRFF